MTIKGTGINVVFDGPPSHTPPRFVELETDTGRGVREPLAEWTRRDDDYWSLRINPLQAMKFIQAAIYDTSYSHGWYEEPRTFGDRMALIHSEVSEALEHFRGGDDMTRIKFSHMPSCKQMGHYTYIDNPRAGGCNCTPKPDGIAVELADVIIRILDMAEAEGIPVLEAIEVKMRFNEGRPHRHGGKAL